VLDGVVGSSRVPCDLGWVPHSWQIGLTGRTVTPDLYFAVGISGAGHHMAGCGNAKTIVAINTDPEAAIFRSARFGIVGDYRKVVPALVAALKDI
jgi:electron transfer flavoprotein alpha subunit